MNYGDALRVLDERQETRVRLGLARVRRRLRALGDPQDSFRAAHVAGTNGKGSVSAMLAAACRAAGLRTGLYTSPHLESPRERIRVDGRPISPAAFARTMERALKGEDEPLTYFELLTVMAFLHFRDRRVDAAVLETGLGGRLDATNVLRRPLASVIPTIDFDHMDWLGSSLKGIAREKAAIFRRGAPALTAETKPAALAVLRSAARRRGAPFVAVRAPWRVDSVDWARGRQRLRGPGGRRAELSLLGSAQGRNAALAAEAVDALRSQGLPVTREAFARGLASLRWPGRFEVVRLGRRTAVLDGAHNVQAMRHFRRTFESSPWRRGRVRFLFGALRDKEHGALARVLAPLVREAVICRPPSPRALEPGTLAGELRRAAPRARITVIADPVEAVSAWKRGRHAPPVLCVCGSFYLVAAARRALGLS